MFYLGNSSNIFRKKVLLISDREKIENFPKKEKSQSQTYAQFRLAIIYFSSQVNNRFFNRIILLEWKWWQNILRFVADFID